MNNMHRKAVKCYDCGIDVPGSIREHHKICPNSRKIKSTVIAAHKNDARLSNSKSDRHNKKDFSDTKDVYFILDVSGSMDGFRLRTAKECVRNLIQEIDPYDRMAIITFDTSAFFKLKPRPVQQIIRQNELDGILDRIFAQGRTALYDAISLGMDQMFNNSKKTIFNVLTDGMDNSSSITYEQLMKKIEDYPNITLNIIHVDNNNNQIAQYSSLCENRGEYKVIVEEHITMEYTKVFHKFYKM